MIYGIGMDLVAVNRMQENIKRYGRRFAGKILSAEELPEYESAHHPARYLAKRFAAKEALVKALGTGFSHGISLKHISIKHGPLGQPEINCAGKLIELMRTRLISACHLTLTDEKDYACACVILEKGTRAPH